MRILVLGLIPASIQSSLESPSPESIVSAICGQDIPSKGAHFSAMELTDKQKFVSGLEQIPGTRDVDFVKEKCQFISGTTPIIGARFQITADLKNIDPTDHPRIVIVFTVSKQRTNMW